MKLVRYLNLRVLYGSAVALVLLVIVYASIDFVEAASMISLPVGKLIAVYLYRLPMIVGHTLPVALTLGVQVTVARAMRTGEWDAIGVAGVSPMRISGTLAVVPLVATVVSVFLMMHFAPAALKQWSAKAGSAPQATNTKWCKSGDTLVRIGDGQKVVIQRSGGEAASVFSRSVGDVHRHWAKGQGWSEGAGPVSADCAVESDGFDVQPMVLVGGASTLEELDNAIAVGKDRGWSTAPLEGERALRVALALSCLIVPMLALLGSLVLRISGTTNLITASIAAAVVYWLVLAVAWNGVSLGIWPPVLVSAVLPGFFMTACAALFVRVGNTA